MDDKTWNKYMHMREERSFFLGDVKQGHRKYTLEDFDEWLDNKVSRDHNFMNRFRRMLIIGAGDGCEVKYMREKGFEVIGIDFDDNHFNTHPEVISFLRRMDMHEMTLRPRSADIIYTSHTLEHALAPYIVFCQMNRVLKVGGIVYMSIPQHVGDWVRDPNHISILTELQGIHMAEKTGFHCAEYRLTKLPEVKRRDASQIFVLEKMGEILE